MKILEVVLLSLAAGKKQRPFRETSQQELVLMFEIEESTEFVQPELDRE